MNLNMLSAKSWICSEVINISGIVLLLWFGSLDVTSDRLAQMFERHMGEIRRGFFARPGIEVSAPPFYRLGYVQLTAAGGPLEKHVLDKV